MQKDKEQMTTNERIDLAAEEGIANNDANTERVLQRMGEYFEEAFPKQINIRSTNLHTSRQRATVTTTRLRKATMKKA